ncbi:uncharacterized protein BT62DRAFT_913855, partial [Guyanagaster necrorhizus]
FSDCLSSGDRSYIHLMDHPTKNEYAYWCHKEFYTVHNHILTFSVFFLTSCQLIIQATIDYHTIFTLYDFGWSGSVQDHWIFCNSHLWQHYDDYFQQHKYILIVKDGYSHYRYTIY